MNLGGTVYPRRRATSRQWLALGGAALAMLLVLLLIASACRSHDTSLTGSPAPGGSTNPSSQADADAATGKTATGKTATGEAVGGGAGGLGNGPPPGGHKPDGPPPGDPPDEGHASGGDPEPAGVVLQDYQLIRQESTVAAGGFLRSSARCPAGTVVVGGGVRLVGEGSGDFGTIVRESAPGTIGGGNQSLWLAAFANPGPAPRTAEIRAVCAAPIPGYEVLRTDATIASGGFHRLAVSCPDGRVALAGGVQVVGAGSADFQTALQESAPGTLSGAATSWVSAVSNHSGADRTIGFKVVCADAPAGYQVVGEDATVPAHGFVRQTAVCPAGTVVLGGGGPGVVSGDTNFQTVVRESAPGILDDPHFQWMSAVANNGDAARVITVRAVCAQAA